MTKLFKSQGFLRKNNIRLKNIQRFIEIWRKFIKVLNNDGNFLATIILELRRTDQNRFHEKPSKCRLYRFLIYRVAERDFQTKFAIRKNVPEEKRNKLNRKTHRSRSLQNLKHHDYRHSTRALKTAISASKRAHYTAGISGEKLVPVAGRLTLIIIIPLPCRLRAITHTRHNSNDNNYYHQHPSGVQGVRYTRSDTRCSRKINDVAFHNSSWMRSVIASVTDPRLFRTPRVFCYRPTTASYRIAVHLHLRLHVERS